MPISIAPRMSVSPAEVYRDSERRYEGTPEDLDYGAMTTRKVSANGLIRVGGTDIQISTAISGWERRTLPPRREHHPSLVRQSAARPP